MWALFTTSVVLLLPCWNELTPPLMWSCLVVTSTVALSQPNISKLKTYASTMFASHTSHTTVSSLSEKINYLMHCILACAPVKQAIHQSLSSLLDSAAEFWVTRQVWWAWSWSWCQPAFDSAHLQWCTLCRGLPCLPDSLLAGATSC